MISSRISGSFSEGPTYPRVGLHEDHVWLWLGLPVAPKIVGSVAARALPRQLQLGMARRDLSFSLGSPRVQPVEDGLSPEVLSRFLEGRPRLPRLLLEAFPGLFPLHVLGNRFAQNPVRGSLPQTGQLLHTLLHFFI